MSYKSNSPPDSDLSMFTANSDTLTAADSSFDMSGNITDITADFTAQESGGKPVAGRKNLSDIRTREEKLFGHIDGKSKSTPSKKQNDAVIDIADSTNLITRERGEPKKISPKQSDPSEKGKLSDSDDSVMLVITEDSLNSGDHSDADTSIEDPSDSLKEKKSTPPPNPPSLSMKIANIDDNLPPTVTLLKTPDGSKVYIVGTAHFSEESQNDVSKIIQSVHPHIVMVELCSQRVNILQLDEETILEEAKNIDFQKIRATIQQNGFFNGLIYILLLNMSAHITKELGMAPGGEFRRALHESKNIPHCIVHLGDRPIQVTMHRALAALSWWQTVRLVWRLINTKDPITKEEVERCKQRDLLKEMIAEMAGEFPALERVFVRERDVYLTYSLQLAAVSKTVNEPTRVVGVVGIGHVQGILDHWGKVTSRQIPPIMKIPPPSLSSRVIKVSIKVAFVGLIVFAGYKVIPKKWLP